MIIINCLVVIILFFTPVFLFYFVRYLIEVLKRKRFKQKYKGISIPKKMIIKRKKNFEEANNYYFTFPYWCYANKDGSKNKVRKKNHLVYGFSRLVFNEYEITTKQPSLLLDLVNELRMMYGADIIPKNREEIKKYKDVKNKKEKQVKYNKIQDVIDKFENEPTEFENFCADLYIKLGYKAVVTPKTNDGGYDIVMSKNNVSYIVECKCYEQDNVIGRPLIQKIVGANHEANANKVMFVTTSSFSSEAKEYAKLTDVKLVDGNELLNMINNCFEHDLVEVVLDYKDWMLTKEDLKLYLPPDFFK